VVFEVSSVSTELFCKTDILVIVKNFIFVLLCRLYSSMTSYDVWVSEGNDPRILNVVEMDN